jgi:hypothetical protein
MKEKAMEIIQSRIQQVADATNKDELTNFEYFAHGAANAMWELGIFTQAEHTENFDRIAAVTEQKLKGWEESI